ncbi:DUF4157 domain-containing protein [Azohydromonas sp. G-1-1-14]|uniref:DUF4157 domain-containing protein n=2 Tax=Azohydromonas caseinilytica TaxID=2728836 RepID=A0A848FG28_9BURK|nr:DUF4157 domain-containing protein [Azohydromonas caseinilytica]
MRRLPQRSSDCACGGGCPRCQASSRLSIGAPDDRFEREADRMADAVMHGGPAVVEPGAAAGLQPLLRRKPLEPEDVPDSMPAPEGRQPAMEQAGTAPEEDTVQRSPSATAAPGPTVTPQYEHALQHAIAGGGHVLPAATRAYMEGHFGHDFSAVRIHSDGRAASLARQIDARAFTIGHDIFFGAAEYAPTSYAGQRLLAHELTHVLQQSDGRLSRQQLRRTPCSSYPGYDASVNRLSYNCAGLALRTYRFTSPPSAVYADMAKEFDRLVCPVGNCGAGQVKFWLWTYDIRTEDDLGNVVDPTWRDFHIVGGRMDGAGNDPTNVYGKNGPRPIHGPGTGPSFRPAGRDRALDRDDNPGDAPNGRPLYKVRTNMREVISCGDCR